MTKHKPEVRLIEVAVQPFFILDDGENAIKLPHDPVVIPAAEWPTYSSERFPAEVSAWQKEIDEHGVGARVPTGDGNSNRVQRRAAQRRAAPRRKSKSSTAKVVR